MVRTGGTRRVRVAVAAAGAVTAWSLTGATGAATVPPAPAPPPGSILEAQVGLVTAQRQPLLSADRLRVGATDAALAAARARQSSDQALAASAATRAAAAAAAIGTDQAGLASHAAARDAAAAAAGDDRRRLRAVGVELYVGPQVTPVDGPDSLARAQQEMFATEVIDIGAGALVSDLHQRAADRQRATRAVANDTKVLAADRAALARAVDVRDHRAALLGADAATVAAATAAAGASQAQLERDTAALAAAVAALANPPGAPADGSPTIVGPAALTADELAGWFNDRGYADRTSAPVTQLAGYYLSEGAAEGVRGDVAFAQATLETGGFASNDAVTRNNYAGIGHCDSCGAGLAFGSPQLGVRGQIQLLHVYADAALTTATLANPLVAAPITPQTEPARGCCSTWQSLTGRWATDPSYGQSIMRLYRGMLADALARAQG